MKTITVQGFLGKDKQINREDFVKTWKDHANELQSVGNNHEQWNEIKQIIRRVEELAGERFDLLLKREDANLDFKAGIERGLKQ